MRDVSRWTRAFAGASALALPVVLGVEFAGVGRRAVGAAGVLWFVCPMVFGMAYLLLPPYVGRTLPFERLPGAHFVAAYAGSFPIVASTAVRVPEPVVAAGVLTWSAGVAVFLGSLTWVAGSAIRDDSRDLLGTDRPQRSTRTATLAIPVALGYLAVGTVGLLAWAGLVPAPIRVTLPRVLHAYAAGFAALLVFALGARLLTGFFHAAPPRRPTWVVLAAGSVGPALLATHLWGGLLFRVGAVLEATAMVGYAGLVAHVAVRSSWDRVGLYGVGLGAVAGAVGVAAALALALGRASADPLAVHDTALLAGFFPLTVVGYAYQFFPVTTGRFAAATERAALGTISSLAAGVALRVAGHLAGSGNVAAGGWAETGSALGVACSVLGGVGYAYLLGRRLSGA